MDRASAIWVRALSDYGMAVVLLAVGGLFSAWTVADQYPVGEAGGRSAAEEVRRRTAVGARVLIVTQDLPGDDVFAAAARTALGDAGWQVIETVKGEPTDARRALARLTRAGESVQAILATPEAGAWELFDVGYLEQQFPPLHGVQVVVPESYRWPNFLRAANLVNIADQMAVIAIMAIGMTLVIITGGIDLSVGSLMAVAAVLAALLIRDYGGAERASAAGMALSGAAAVLACGVLGLVNGALATRFGLPAFIVTLGMMGIGSGLAGRLSGGGSIYQVPAAFTGLGRGSVVAGVPNPVALMLLLYVAAHLLMSRTVLGRYLYAIGGNAEAARLAGVPVRRVVVFAYVVSGTLAGLGGVMQASLLKSGGPTYGQGYELSVIAAVVVGGTSIRGGEGKVFGTFLGALLIAVIRNGMNLVGLSFWDQHLVLGTVVIAAVLLDRLKQRAWDWLHGG